MTSHSGKMVERCTNLKLKQIKLINILELSDGYEKRMKILRFAKNSCSKKKKSKFESGSVMAVQISNASVTQYTEVSLA